MQVIAPAKINLSLRVLGRRSDGFHEIETFIAPISLCDEIKIEGRSGKQEIAFRCDDPSVGKSETNLVVRAEKDRLVVQVRPNRGDPQPDMPAAFYGPDRAVVTSGPEKDASIEFIRDAKVIAPGKPWFMYLCPGCGHAPHHVPREWADKYRGRFDMGYEKYREWALAKGFLECVAGPLVRSSYRAERALERNNAGLRKSG